MSTNDELQAILDSTLLAYCPQCKMIAVDPPLPPGVECPGCHVELVYPEGAKSVWDSVQ